MTTTPRPTRSEVARLYLEEKLSTRRIATKLGQSQGWVTQQLRDAGVQARPRSVPGRTSVRLVEVKPLAVEAMRQGTDRAEIQGLHRVSISTLSRWAREAGLPPLPRGPKSKHTAEVVGLYREDLSLQAVGVEVGVHYTTVWRNLRRAGEPIRARGAPRKASADLAAAEVRATGCRVVDAASRHKASVRTTYTRLRQLARQDATRAAPSDPQTTPGTAE